MFDLFRSRAKAVRYLLGGLLMLVALSMVVTLIPGYGTGGGQQDQVLAEVGKETVTARDVQQQMQAAMRNQRFRPEMAGYFAGQLIDEMIGTRALILEAKRLGLEVTDAELARALRTNFPMLFPNGQFVGKEAYSAMLQQQGRTIPEFEDAASGTVAHGAAREPGQRRRYRDARGRREAVPSPQRQGKARVHRLFARQVPEPSKCDAGRDPVLLFKVRR